MIVGVASICCAIPVVIAQAMWVCGLFDHDHLFHVLPLLAVVVLGPFLCLAVAIVAIFGALLQRAKDRTVICLTAAAVALGLILAIPFVLRLGPEVLKNLSTGAGYP